MTYNTLRLEEADDILTVTLHRPARRNALNPEMMDELLRVFDEAGKSTSGVLILTGTGDAFCAGLDIEHLQALQNKSKSEHEEDALRVVRLFRALYDLPLPTVAAVNGPALAGGMGLATLCDFTLAVPEAKFGYTEVRIGFIPAVVSSFLVLQVGEKQARDLLLTGRLIVAEEALSLGLVNGIVDAPMLMVHARALAQSLLQNSPEAMRTTKRLLSSRVQERLDQELQSAIAWSAKARATKDFREGVAAFLEKRKPAWPSKKKTVRE